MGSVTKKEAAKKYYGYSSRANAIFGFKAADYGDLSKITVIMGFRDVRRL